MFSNRLYCRAFGVSSPSARMCARPLRSEFNCRGYALAGVRTSTARRLRMNPSFAATARAYFSLPLIALLGFSRHYRAEKMTDIGVSFQSCTEKFVLRNLMTRPLKSVKKGGGSQNRHWNVPAPVLTRRRKIKFLCNFENRLSRPLTSGARG